MMFVTGTMLNSSQDYSVLSPGVDEGAQSVQANHLAPDQPQHWQVSWNEVRLRTQSSLLQTHAFSETSPGAAPPEGSCVDISMGAQNVTPTSSSRPQVKSKSTRII